MTILTDDSPMPFGKHQDKLMSEVPPKYLFWLWTNGLESAIETSDVANYISRHLPRLKKKLPDAIW